MDGKWRTTDVCNRYWMYFHPIPNFQNAPSRSWSFDSLTPAVQIWPGSQEQTHNVWPYFLWKSWVFWMFPERGRRNNGKSDFLFPGSLFPVFQERNSADFAWRLYGDSPVSCITKYRSHRRINIRVEMVKWQAGRWMEDTNNRKQQVVDFSMGKS